MKTLPYRIVLLIALSICVKWMSIYAQTTTNVQGTSLAHPGFDTARINTYLSDPIYQYQRRSPETSWLSNLWHNIRNYIASLFSEGSGMGEQILVILLITGMIIVLVYFFLRSRFQQIFSRSNRKMGASMRILNEDVAVHSLTQKIHDAILAGDFRTAYRWTYIDLLHRMDQAGLLHLHGNKTNRDYKREMHTSSLKEEFAMLADAFDFIWYGEYPIDQKTYDRYRTLSDAIFQQMPVK